MKTTEDLLNDLNESQRAAVEYCDGSQLVIAGAGSGKTRVLTYKIAYLLRNGVKPWNILALTFTNKAANEMKERVAQLVDQRSARALHMGTFHSVLCRLLRYEAEHIGYTSSFTIYDENDSRSLLSNIIKGMGLDDKLYKPALIHDIISRAKNNLLSPQAYKVDNQLYELDRRHQRQETGNIYTAYCQRCRAAMAMDFDDILVNAYVMLRDNANIRQKYGELFHYILVDEYQDTNYAQQRILSQLYEVHRCLCVVGDDAQSIYSFRGANLDNMLSFEKDDNFRLFKLERNYRSTQNIVSAANSLIRHNKMQIKKDVFSNNEVGDKVKIVPVYSDKEEAALVLRRLIKLKEKTGCSYNDFAVLYRTSAQSRCFEDEMQQKNIPYKVYGGVSFYQTKEIKDIVAYLRLTINPHDEEAIKRIINYPTRGIGATTINKIATVAQQHNVSMWDVVGSPAQYSLDVNRGTLTKIAAFHNLIASFIEEKEKKNAFDFGNEVIMRSGIHAAIFSDRSLENAPRIENVEEFISALKSFVDNKEEEGDENNYITDFLQEASLLSDNNTRDDETDKVSLMTIHAAKGLEFETVFIVGVEENIIPNVKALNSLKEVEEERRLLYVAMTRAKQNCIISYAGNRYRNGKIEYNPPSRFLRDIDSKYTDTASSGFAKKTKTATIDVSPRLDNIWKTRFSPQYTSSPKPHNGFVPVANAAEIGSKSATNDCGIKVGTIIEHQRFGIGEVFKVEGSGENTKATVQFRNVGTKQLLLKFAKYNIIDKK